MAVLFLSPLTLLQAQKLGTGCLASHVAVLKYDGTAYTWGENSGGKLGDNTYVNKSTPVAVSTDGVLKDKTITAIAVGQKHTIVLTSDGKVYTWGGNNYGQLGNGDDSKASKCVPVAVSADGVLKNKTITAIAAGGYHSVALASDGTVYTWGDNTAGQLGNNDFFKNRSSVPVAVYTGTSTSDALYGKTIVAIAAGNGHTVAVDNNGKVYTWGWNSNGQLGNDKWGENENSIAPVAVYTGTSSSNGALYGKKVTAIAAGNYHTVALTSDGKVFSWGASISGQLGNQTTTTTNTTRPVAVYTGTSSSNGALYGKTIKSIVAGADHTVVLDNDGKVYTWGSNWRGQLGVTLGELSNVPVAVYTGTGTSNGELFGKTIIAIAAGYNYTIALDNDGTLYTWGDNSYGQLGNGTTTSSNVPVAVDQTEMGALPVELSTFTARVTGSGVELLWETATEVNNAVFEIERQSKNDAEWKKIGEVLGNGTSNAKHSYSYFDNSALSGNYRYRLRQVDNDGRFEYSQTIEVCAGVPTETELVQNYPNPFNPSTVIGYRLSGQENVELSVYNMLGQKVVTLVNERQEAGVYSVRFNASELSSGLYIAKLRTGNFTKTIKMNFVK